MKSSYLFLGALFIVMVSACEKEEPNVIVDTGFTHGVFITSEGAYGNSNGSVSYLDQDSMILRNNFFNEINGRPLGDVVQSLAIHDGRAYIVVNNSQKVEVIDLKSFTSVGLIEGLSYPRYFLGIDEEKGYVTNGSMTGQVYVINLTSLTIIDSIQVGSGPEQMLKLGDRVYVANSGGHGIDSTLSVIDSGKDEVLETIQVGHAPLSLTLDANEDLWVLCKGKVVWGADWSITEETDSELIRLNTGSNQIESRMTIGMTGDFFWPSRMTADKDKTKIWFTEAGGLYEMAISASTQPSQAAIPKAFYGFGVDPVSGVIFGLASPSFTEAGYMFRYQADGALIDSLKVGIGPSSAIFN